MGLATFSWASKRPLNAYFAVSALFFWAKASVNFYKFRSKIPIFPVGPVKESGKF